MLNTSIQSWYAPQKKLFRRIISLLFTFAGIYWLIIYGLMAADLLGSDDLVKLRSGQTIIYFILLTLWGVEYLREASRLKAIINASNEMECAADQVQSGHVAESIASFAIISGFSGAAKTWILPALNLAGLAISAALILLQYVRMFQAAFG